MAAVVKNTPNEVFMKIDNEGRRRRLGEMLREEKKKNSTRVTSRERGITAGKITEMKKMLECASKMSSEEVCGQFVEAFFFF